MQLIEFFITALLWVTTIWRGTKDWRPGQSRALWWAFFGLTVMMTLRLPVGRMLDEMLGVADLSYLLKHLFGGVLGSAALLAFLKDVSGNRDTRVTTKRLRIALPIVTAICMSALFFAKLQPYETLAIYQDFGARLALLLYTVIFLGFLSLSLCNGVRVSWRWGRDKGNGALGWGLRLIGIGLGIGVVYALVRIIALVTRFEGNGVLPGNLDDQVTSYLLLTTLFLVVTGSTLPVLGKLRSWQGERRGLHRLRALWRELTEAVPSVRLDPPRRRIAELLDVRHVQDRLYRRTVEIRDAALTLNDHVTTDVELRAHEHVAADGLIGTQAETAAEACRLAAARRARLRGDASTPRPHEPSGGGSNLTSEIRALTQLSDAYFSNLTRSFIDATEHRPSAPTLETQQ
ncbi:MAB_1171c family putative transporter [Streptomyces sp. NPDC048172]|uniref:MAB_1171c family putative transporter n=1 Tax=Streptomyces sp. NPDC048172 TaxID=3365505 RepID=UPI003711EAE8